MNLRDTILKEHSRSQCDKIVHWVSGKQERFDELFNLFLHDEYRVVQRAAWPVSFCVISSPSLIKKHWGSLIKNLQKPGIHDAVKRNTIRLLEDVPVPPKYQGAVMNICFHYLQSPKEAIAIKVFSMSVLANLAKQYPEIIPELKLMIADQLPHQTAAFRARAKKVLKQLNSLSFPHK